MNIVDELITRMVEFDRGDAKRIQHFLKVHSLCKYMGTMEGLDGDALRTLEITAVLHDIGVIPAEQEFGTCAGPYQEKLGPPIAMAMLDEVCRGKNSAEYKVSAEARERIRYLIGHHHTYDHIEGQDYQILVEADFLVNLYEKASSENDIRAALCNIFRTETGRSLCRKMFGIGI